MAQHHDEQRVERTAAERARLSRRLRQIAEALNLPITSFFGRVEGTERDAHTEQQPQQANSRPTKK